MRYVEVDVSCTRSADNRVAGMRSIPCLVNLVQCPAQVTTVTYGRDGRPLVCPLLVYGPSPESTSDEARTKNSAVEAMVAESYPSPRCWHGPALVLKCENLAMNSFVDVVNSDLDDIRAFFALS